eukprot:s48_g45.t1
MGCGASSAKVMHFDDLSVPKAIVTAAPRRLVVDFEAMETGEEMTKQSTLRSWTMADLPGVPLPPNRAMHERHMRRLNRYLRIVERTPQVLCGDVAWRRILEEGLQEQTK